MNELEENIKRKDLGEDAHKHASKRLVTGISALVVLIVVGFFVWSNWANKIKEVCLGENGVCSVDLTGIQ